MKRNWQNVGLWRLEVVKRERIVRRTPRCLEPSSKATDQASYKGREDCRRNVFWEREGASREYSVSDILSLRFLSNISGWCRVTR